jgi:hypothetical protein
MSEPMKIKKEERTIVIVVSLLVIGIIVLAVLLIRDYRTLNRSGYINFVHGYRARMARIHAPLTVNDLNVIQSWMTFDYINRIFAVPPSVLQTALKVADVHYPRLSVHEYAEAGHISVDVALQNIKDSLRSYLTSKK